VAGLEPFGAIRPFVAGRATPISHLLRAGRCQTIIKRMLDLALESKGPLRLLCLGAHCDDIEIGCGGTILKLAARHREVEVHWVVFSSDEQRKKEALDSAHAFLENVPGRKIVIGTLRDGFFPYLGVELKERFEQLKAEFSPNLILTHYRQDLHQDHRLVSELTWNTFRNHLILEYEIPKYESTCRRKISLILRHFSSQEHRQWFGEDVFRAVMRLRGLESNAASKYAEAFYCRKIVLG
jgi:LmbE family N-acetylglucosaminyl deacetylase